jgi:colanic acid/amylovoran biosynthesis glycosyltransferase
MPPHDTPRVGYVVSQYPSPYTPYLERQVRDLEAVGLDLRVCSVLPSPNAVHVIRRSTARSAATTLLSHLALALARPRVYAATVRAALGMGGPDVRQALGALRHFSDAVLIARWMRRARVEHVHAHFAASATVLAGRLANVPVSVTLHGVTDLADSSPRRLRAITEGSAFVVTISRYTRAQVLRCIPLALWPRVHAVPLGYRPDDATAAARPVREAGAPLTLIVVARLVPQKGHAVLLEALARLRAGGRDVRLVVVGDGPTSADLHAAVARLGLEGAITWRGVLDEAGVAAALDRADAFVLPSFAEGLPIALMEAMGRGLPCVATSVHGVPELARDGATALLVAPADADALAAAIARLADDPALGARLGAAARAFVAEAYAPDRQAATLAALVLAARTPAHGSLRLSRPLIPDAVPAVTDRP